MGDHLHGLRVIHQAENNNWNNHTLSRAPLHHRHKQQQQQNF